MKTICKYIMPLVVLIVCISCKKDNQVNQDDQVTKVTQRIVGADDCIQNYGWSWRNGEASTFEVDDDYEYSQMSFKTKVNGNLSCTFYGSSKDYYIELIINGTTYFKDGTDISNYTYYSERYTDIGNVKSNEIVIIRGVNCKVKDIKIVGLPDNSGKEEPDDDPQWDF